MRDRADGKASRESADSHSDTGRGGSARDKARGRGGSGRGHGFVPPFPPNLMQMLPLIMAMGGSGMPGMGMSNTQIQLMIWAIETWLDYLAAVQEVFERALDRLHEMNLGGGWMGGGDGGDEGGASW